MQIPSEGFLDRGLQMQDSQAYPLLTNPCAGRKLGEDVESCLVSGGCTHWREGGKEAWWWVVMACPSTQDLRSTPIPTPPFLTSHTVLTGSSKPLKTELDRTPWGEDTVQTQGSRFPASLPSHPKSCASSPALVGWHPYILPQAHVLPQAHDLSGSGLLFPTRPTAPGP